LPDLQIATAGAWLRNHGYHSTGCTFAELGGGVSNVVLLADSRDLRLVIKQSLGKLRVTETWESDRGRIFREAAAMKWLSPRLPGVAIPRLLIEDREAFVIAMEAAPAGAVMWKSKLFAGEHNAGDARTAGMILGRIIAASWRNPEAREIFGDQTVFDQLRLDPYYRFTARRHPDLAPYFRRLIERCAARAVSLVHGDFSPKNLLVANGEMWVIDWEVVHYGDPSFDAGFLLNHLLLKSIALPRYREPFATLAQAFFDAIAEQLPPDATEVIPGAFEHLPALLLARADGKSPAEYLDEAGRQRARELSRSLIADPAQSIAEVFQR